MIQKVSRYIRQQQLLKQGDQVTAGVSGGADSVCLLLCLAALSREWELRLQAVHVHHGLRGEAADGDQAFVEDLCRRLGIPCRCHRVNVAELAAQNRQSLEEAGRNARYAILRREAGAGKIAVAHHQGDQAETVLGNLLRGTGIRGAAGMAPEAGGVIRPLLACTRQEIEGFLREQGQGWREDATNREDGYTRNRIRRHLLPLAEREVNARSQEHLAAFAEQARELDQLLETLAAPFLGQREEREGRWGLPAALVAGQPPALGKRILAGLVEQAAGTRKDLGALHLNALWELLQKPVGSRLDLPGGVQAERGYRWVWLGREPETEPEPHLPPMRQDQISRKEFLKTEENRCTKCFDYDKIKTNAVLRFRREGDYLTLPGGGHKSVKKYMIEAKIPARERGRIPVLADGSHVIWVVGYRVSAGCRVTEETQRVLRVTIGG